MFGARFVIKKNGAGEFYFILKAGNNEVIAVSESYKTKQSCKVGIRSVRHNALFAGTEDTTI